jgi:ATP-dependent RNA helicase DeaD
MDSFEDLGLSPELVEALASEGIEIPTPLQVQTLPVVRKANNVLLNAGPGAGVQVAWLPGVLDRCSADADSPTVLVACPTGEMANALAEPAARLAAATGHSVASLSGSWLLPERAQIVFGAADDLLERCTAGTLDVSSVACLVVEQAQLLSRLGSLDLIERLLDFLPKDCQRLLTALPLDENVQKLASRHLKRAVRIPAAPTVDSTDRGEVHFRITAEPKEAGVLSVVEELFAEGAKHVLVFCRNEDRIADVGDYLTLHGFLAGAPGDTSSPVWLGVDPLEAREAVGDTEDLVIVSCDVPSDQDALDRRHSLAPRGVVVVLARELAHLKWLGRATGYRTVPFPPKPRPSSDFEIFRGQLEQALADEDVVTYLVALEPLFERHDPALVAAAAASLLRKKNAPETPRASSKPDAPSVGTGTTWSKLFVTVGTQDGLTTGDLLGAITGEANVSGDAVGRIDIRERHTIVEVHEEVARAIIRAVNGTTIRGRAVRVDFDRPRRQGSTRPAGRR